MPTSPRYVYPPRPKTAIPPSILTGYEGKGWFWQLKYDGDRMPSFVDTKTGSVYLASRRGKFHKMHSHPSIRQELLELNLPTGSHILDGEFLTPQILVLFDILQLKEYLIGWEQSKRWELLQEVCRNPSQKVDDGIAYHVSPHVWLALSGPDNFPQAYAEYSGHKLIEGLVLRQLASHLDEWGNGEYEVDWQVRCRRPSKHSRY